MEKYVLILDGWIFSKLPGISCLARDLLIQFLNSSLSAGQTSDPWSRSH